MLTRRLLLRLHLRRRSPAIPQSSGSSAGELPYSCYRRVQAHARFGYEMTLKKMQNRIALRKETAKPLLVSEAKEMIQGFPSATEVSDRHWIQRTYTWRGLTQSYKIILNFDNSEPQPAVMSLLMARHRIPLPSRWLKRAIRRRGQRPAWVEPVVPEWVARHGRHGDGWWWSAY